MLLLLLLPLLLWPLLAPLAAVTAVTAAAVAAATAAAATATTADVAVGAVDCSVALPLACHLDCCSDWVRGNISVRPPLAGERFVQLMEISVAMRGLNLIHPVALRPIHRDPPALPAPPHSVPSHPVP